MAHPGEALEERLRRQPDDREAWLVYADWLIDRGDVRGRLVGLEHRLHESRSDEERAVLQREVDALLQRHQEQWLEGWSCPGGLKLEWRSGFVTAASLQDEDALPALARLAELPAARLLASLTLRGKHAELLRALLPLLPGQIRRLEIDHGALDPQTVRVLTRAEETRSIVALSLQRTLLEDAGALALADATGLGALERLRLDNTSVGVEGIRALARSEAWPSLTELELGYHRLGPEGARALAESPALRALTSLNLYADALGDKGAIALASGPFSSLRRLELRRNRIATPGVCALARSETLRGLLLLDLRDNQVTDDGYDALVASGMVARGVVRL